MYKKNIVTVLLLVLPLCIQAEIDNSLLQEQMSMSHLRLKQLQGEKYYLERKDDQTAQDLIRLEEIEFELTSAKAFLLEQIYKQLGILDLIYSKTQVAIKKKIQVLKSALADKERYEERGTGPAHLETQIIREEITRLQDELLGRKVHKNFGI